jgi:hypothetical protein
MSGCGSMACRAFQAASNRGSVLQQHRVPNIWHDIARLGTALHYTARRGIQTASWWCEFHDHYSHECVRHLGGCASVSEQNADVTGQAEMTDNLATFIR